MSAAGFRGTFVIKWSQTEIDGFPASSSSELPVGASWLWRGSVTRLDGPSSILRLDQAQGRQELHMRASRMVRRLVGSQLETDAAVTERWDWCDEMDAPMMDNSFVVTDGLKSFTVAVIEQDTAESPLLMFVDDIPPRDRELWIVHHRHEREAVPSLVDKAGMICFTPGTRLRTPNGLRLIEELRVGDLVQTKDNGCQPVQWVGSRVVTGARLMAMPGLRPIRFRSHFFAGGEPDQDLIVSPQHRIVVHGPAAQDLFNTPEVLVTAEDLLDGDAVKVDTSLRHVRYIHVMFDEHQVLWANGVETESFHPASTSLASLEMHDRLELLQMNPELAEDPYLYGDFARRNLTKPEAVLLRYAA